MKRAIHCQTGSAVADVGQRPTRPERQVGDPNSHFRKQQPTQVGRATACGIAGCLLSVAFANGLVPPAARAGEPEPVHFSRDILPILSENCFLCHGPDAKARKADLRLDLKETALRKTEAVIVPGKSGESELIERVASNDADEVMPPPKSGKKLTAHQIELLKRWIDQGAQWSKHWAFEPVRRPAAAARFENPDWVRNPIDRFVLARLEARGARPVAGGRSERRLIRRLTLDLTGLPPTPAEVDAFLADASPDAYEELVDRLLASPHYGERMAMDWLDGARYADTNGYQNDFARTMWPWRDWVIAAFNRNQPFDRFVIEQIAGDLLPGAQPRPDGSPPASTAITGPSPRPARSTRNSASRTPSTGSRPRRRSSSA